MALSVDQLTAERFLDNPIKEYLRIHRLLSRVQKPVDTTMKGKE